MVRDWRGGFVSGRPRLRSSKLTCIGESPGLYTERSVDCTSAPRVWATQGTSTVFGTMALDYADAAAPGNNSLFLVSYLADGSMPDAVGFTGPGNVGINTGSGFINTGLQVAVDAGVGAVALERGRGGAAGRGGRAARVARVPAGAAHGSGDAEDGVARGRGAGEEDQGGPQAGAAGEEG